MPPATGNREGVRWLRIVAAWAGYVFVVVTLAGLMAGQGRTGLIPPLYLHGFIAPDVPLPPLFRWDSVWYYAILTEGYQGSGPQSPGTPAFLPLYPAVAWGVTRLGADPLTAMTWTPPLALLAAMLCLARYLRETRQGGDDAPLAALLAFPGSFLLLAAYPASLFLLCAVAAFRDAQAGRPARAAVWAALAGLTRVHVVALAAGLAWLGVERWRRSRRLSEALPAAGAAAGLAVYCGYLAYTFGDPFHYWKVKRAFSRPNLGSPGAIVTDVHQRLVHGLTTGDVGAVQVLLEPLCAVLLLLASWRLWHDHRAEAVYMLTGLALSIAGGSLWGLPRFMPLFFPVFALASGLPGRFPLAFPLTLAVCGLAQAAFLLQFVYSILPAP